MAEQRRDDEQLYDDPKLREAPGDQTIPERMKEGQERAQERSGGESGSAEQRFQGRGDGEERYGNERFKEPDSWQEEEQAETRLRMEQARTNQPPREE